MAAVDEIAIKLGIKTGDLKAALLDANAQIKTFKKAGESSPDEGLMGQLKGIKKSFGDLKSLLAAGGVATAVQQFFALAISRAEELKGVQDENARAVRGFAEGLKGAKDVAGDFAVTVIGTFNRLGEAIGDTINIAQSFVKNGLQGFEVWARTQDAIATTAAAAEEAEKRLAATRKKHGAEFAAITKELENLEKKAADQRLKGVTTLETLVRLTVHQNLLMAEHAKNEGDAITRRRTAVEIAQTQLKIDETKLTLQKEQVAEAKKAADEAKKAQEEAKKAADELAERRALDRKDELELFTLQRKRTDELKAGEKARLEILLLQKREKLAQVEIEDLLKKKITDGLTPAEAKRLAELIKQDEKLAAQIAKKEALAAATLASQLPAEKAVTAEMEQQAEIQREMAERAAQITGTVTNKGDVRELSDIQLKELQRRLELQIAPIKQADRMQGGVGTVIGTYKSIEQLMLQQNLSAVQREVDARRSFENMVKTLGLQYAERTFSPDEFARLSQLINPDLQKKQAQDIANINRTLRNLFPKQANDVRGGP